MKMIKKKKHLLLAAGFGVVFFGSCKKADNNENAEVTCYNYSTTFNDSITPLYTTHLSYNRSEIAKIFQGNNNVIISSTTHHFWGPSLSPDGTKLICYRSPMYNMDITVNDFANAELWMFNSDGTNGQKLFSLSDFGWSKMGMARWAPDGVHLVMAAEKADPTDGNNPHWHLFVTDTAGNLPVKLSTRASYFAYPEINAQGTKITYSAYPIGALSGTNFNCEIFVADINTTTWTMSNEQELTNDGDYDYAPRFSSDGSKIVFSSQTTNNPELYVNLNKVNTDGTGLTVLLENGEANSNPCWNATGTHVFFSYLYSTTCFYSIASIKDDGTEFTELVKRTNTDLKQIDL